MKKKNNKAIALIAVFALLAILIAVYVLVLPKMQPEEEEQVTETRIPLADFKTADMRSITYSYEGEEEIALLYDSRSSTWYAAHDRDFPIKQEHTTAMAEVAAVISATRSFESGEITDSDGGFENPALKLSVTYASGAEFKYSVGAFNPFNGSYYFRIEGDERTYMIPAGLTAKFNYVLYELVQYDTIPVMPEEAISSYDVVQSMLTKTVTDKELIAEIPYLYFTNCIDFKPDGEALDNYGLGGSATTIVVHYSETKTVTNEEGSLSPTTSVTVNYDITFRVGALCETDDTLRYVMYEDSPLVYLMRTDSFDLLIKAEETVLQ